MFTPLCCWLQFKRQLLKEEAALRIYDKATDGEAAASTSESPISCMQHAWWALLDGRVKLS